MYSQEIKLKESIVQDIAHQMSRDVLMTYISLWHHQPYLEERNHLMLKSMLLETGWVDPWGLPLWAFSVVPHRTVCTACIGNMKLGMFKGTSNWKDHQDIGDNIQWCKEELWFQVHSTDTTIHRTVQCLLVSCVYWYHGLHCVESFPGYCC